MSLLLDRFNIRNSRHRVVGNRVPIGALGNRGPVGTSNHLLIVSNNFSGPCRSAANVTNCALICRSHNVSLIRRRPFASARRTVHGNSSVGDAHRLIRGLARHVRIDSASGKHCVHHHVSSLHGLLCTCHLKDVGRVAQ